MFNLTDRNKAFLTLHFAVILFGFTAILGNLIEMSAFMLVWWRVLITLLSLLFVLSIRKQILTIPRKFILIYLGIGFIIGVHWLTFYGAIKLANSSTALICLATTSFFTSLNEPLLLKSRINKLDILFGLAIVPAMWLVSDGLDSKYQLGLITGLVSAYLASVFSVLNKKYISKTAPIPLTFIEMAGVFILLSLMMPFVGEYKAVFFPPDATNWVYILILSLVCTTFAWVISMYSLKILTAFETTLVINLEPIYGIGLAAIILYEHKDMTANFYIGAFLIAIIVFIYPIIKKGK